MLNTPFAPVLLTRLKNLASRLNPAWVAFFGSLALSALAIHGMDGPNRDGMLYIETAELFTNNGFAAARANFDWLFFPICIALVSKITGLGHEASGYLLNIVLVACICATLVQITAQKFNDAAWSACLVTLSLPAFNHFRDNLIREFGFWLFCLLALLVAMNWIKRPTWKGGFAIQTLIATACLFRVEAVAFYASLALWQLMTAQAWRKRFLHLAMLLSLPVCGGLILLGLITTNSLSSSERISAYLSAITPAIVLSRFSLASNQFGTTVLNHYSEKEAASILFFGLFSIIPKKFLLMSGLFLIPLANFIRLDSLRKKLHEWQPMGWFFIVYIAVLTAFVTANLFLTGRYVTFLNILVIPIIAVGFKDLLDRFPRWRYLFVAISILIALANVVSLSPKKTLYRDAGQWLVENSQFAPTMYIGSPRAGYYAGAAYRVIRNKGLSPQEIEQAVQNKQFDFYVLELDLRDAKESEWIHSLNLVEVKRFTNGKKDAVVVLKDGTR